MEVHAHLADRSVQCLALASTNGLRRGLDGDRHGGPLMTPVGDTTLGRVLNVFGEPVDDGPPRGRRRAPPDPRRPAARWHGAGRANQPFVTGIKAIDLLVPLPLGGKAGCSAAPASARRCS